MYIMVVLNIAHLYVLVAITAAVVFNLYCCLVLHHPITGVSGFLLS